MKTTQEKIAVMQHYVNGGDITITQATGGGPVVRRWMKGTEPNWDWINNDYNIAKTKKEGWIIIGRSDVQVSDYTSPSRPCSKIYYDKSNFTAEELKRAVKVEWEE